MDYLIKTVLFIYNICLLLSNTTTLIKYPDYRMSYYMLHSVSRIFN